MNHCQEDDYETNEKTACICTGICDDHHDLSAISDTPTPSGTRSSGKRLLKNRRFSTTPTRRSLSRRSLTRCRRFANSVTAGQRRARAACFPAWSIALIVAQKCATAPPTTLKSGRIILYAPTTAAIREVVNSIGVAIFGGFAQYFATQSIVLLDSLTAPAWYLGGGTLLSLSLIHI